MVKLARWTITHRKYVLLGWVALLAAVNLPGPASRARSGVATEGADG